MSIKYLSLDGLYIFLNKLYDIFVQKDDVPSKISDLENDSGYINSDNIATVEEFKAYLDIP